MDWTALLEEGRKRWASRRGLLIVVLVIFGFALFEFSKVDLHKITGPEWLVICLLVAVVTGVWLVTNRLPRTAKGKVGFGVAIYCENPRHEATLRADLLITLRELLYTSGLRYEFDFIEFSQHIAAKITDQTTAEEIRRKSRVHFLVYGRARARNLPDGEAHVLDLEGLVSHKEVVTSFSRQFSAEFRRIFPRKLALHKEGDIFAFQITAKWIHVVARYIVGIASLISNDLVYSEELFLQLETQLAQSDSNELPALVKIRNSLPRRLEELYRTRTYQLYNVYRMKRDKSVLEELERVLEKLKKYDTNSYERNLVKAICAFVLRRDLAESMSHIESCCTVQDPTWMYSKAFLLAYGGDLEEAYRIYVKAFVMPKEDAVLPIETEEFIDEVLREEPNKHQLYFCLGLINHRVKKDLLSAKRDFSRFLELATPEAFKTQQIVAEKWLQEIEALLREDGVGTTPSNH